jgi:hypothetical protein
VINFQHLIQQWAAGLLQNTYPIGSSLRNSDHQFSATTNVQNARGEFRKWELITVDRATHMYEAVSGRGTWRSDTNASAFCVAHGGRYSFRSEDGPFERDGSTRILSAVLSRSWAAQLCNENCSRVLLQWLASLSVVVADAETARQQQG